MYVLAMNAHRIGRIINNSNDPKCGFMTQAPKAAQLKIMFS